VSFLRWYGTPVAQEWDTSNRRKQKPERPATSDEVSRRPSSPVPSPGQDQVRCIPIRIPPPGSLAFRPHLLDLVGPGDLSQFVDGDVRRPSGHGSQNGVMGVGFGVSKGTEPALVKLVPGKLWTEYRLAVCRIDLGHERRLVGGDGRECRAD